MDLDRLKAVRAGHRGVITKLTRELDEALTGTASGEKVGRLNVIYEQLQNKLSVLQKIDNEVLAVCRVEDIEREIEDSEGVSARILDYKRRIEVFLKPPSTSATIVSTHPPVPAPAATVAASRTRLPKLELQKFKGNFMSWISFWDSFKSAVHDNPDIYKIGKFNYLSSLLEGSASKAVQGLTLTEANYDTAVDLLKARFGNKQAIISAHMDELMKLPDCTLDKPSLLRNIYDKVTVHTRGLHSLGVDLDHYGTLLIPIIMPKLPSEVRLTMARQHPGEVWKIEDLLKTIKTEVEAREASNVIKGMTVRSNPNPRSMNPTASSLYASNQAPKCVYCDGDHYPSAYTAIKEVKDRRAFLLRTGRCFNCLRPQHRARQCESAKKCKHCHKKHHQSICDKSTPCEPTAPPSEPTGTTANTSNTAKGGKLVLLQTAQAVASDDTGKRSVNVRILFDTGSQRSYVTDALVRRLNLKPLRKEKLQLNTFGEPGFRGKSCELVRIRLQGLNGGECSQLQALQFPTICSSLPNLVNLERFPSLLKLDLADPPSSAPEGIDVLIGSDYYWTIVGEEVIRTDGGPTVVKSKLGWLLSGPLATSDPSGTTITHLALCKFPGTVRTPDTDEYGLTDILKSFWEIESMGIKEGPNDSETNPELFLTNVKFAHGRYEVGLPWLRERSEVTDHYNLCFNRLKCLQRRLIKEPDMLMEYQRLINDQLSCGIIEGVSNSDSSLSDQTCIHYMPRHPVVKQNRSTTKVRIVYDGSATSHKQLSLNDCLQVGPNPIPKLFNVLIRFRCHQVALVADIEKAFLMISVAEEDRDMLRFLWLREPFKEDSEIIQFRFARLVFGLRPSPAILGAVISLHIEKYRSEYPRIVDLIDQSLYVDDLVSGGTDVHEAFDVYQTAKLIMYRGGFNLRKWHSNSLELLELIRQSENNLISSTDSTKVYESKDSSDTRSEETNLYKLLGIDWNNLRDEFTFEFGELIQFIFNLPKTKRSILKLTASLFDPLGLLSPFVITLKVLFQDLCASQVDWDEPLSDELRRQWESIVKDLESFTHLKVPRCCILVDQYPTYVWLHGFSDASQRAYAAVLYLSSSYADNHTEVRLLCSKTRVAPTKRQTIPRLELLGALILARLVQSVSASLPVLNGTYLWTDSMAVLHWICNKKVWKQYVQHRVNEIRELTDSSYWNYCPGMLNPADLPSRGLGAIDLINKTLWWNGPEFIATSNICFPVVPDIDVTSETQTELSKCQPTMTRTLTALDVRNVTGMEKLIDPSSHGSLDTLLRILAYVLRFIDALMKRKGVDCNGLELTASEMSRSETLWIQAVQQCSFEREIQFLLKPTGACPQLVDQFSLFVDNDQLLKCRGRINNSQFPISSKNPILLPSRHPFVTLLIRKTHELSKHSGVNQTLTTLRERFWVLRGRQVTRNIIRSCVICRRMEGPSYASTSPPDLPTERVSEDPPFSHTGVDFAGPLYVSDSRRQSDDQQEKVYICLFTCAATRAVHLELTRDIGVETFLLALRRFAGRRGLPATMISDNAKTFKSSSKQITKIIRSSEVQKYLTRNRITWKFIVERAPWWGGGFGNVLFKMLNVALGNPWVEQF